MQASGLTTHIKSKPVWIDPSPRPVNLKLSQQPDEVDVAIIGGGYTGLSAARILAKQDISVAVLEAKTLGWGASSRNGGIAIPGNRQSMQFVMRKYGEKLAHEFWHTSIEAIDLLGEIVADDSIQCHFARKGHIHLAAKPSHFATLRKKSQWYKYRLNYKLPIISPNELQAEIGSKVFHGGLVEEWSASLHPTKFLYGLAHTVTEHGGLLCENKTVSQITPYKKQFKIQTRHGTTLAHQVIVATNGYTNELLPELKTRIVPTGSYVIVTEPLPPMLLNKISPNGRSFYDSLRHPHYFRLTPNGRLLFGGYPELTTNLSTKTSAERLYAKMVQIFPDLTGIPITHSWTGQIGSTTDLMPHIGNLKGIHYALGYSGLGVSMATYLGSEIGKLISGQITRSPFKDIGHPNRHPYKNYRWFWTLKAKYDRLMDKLT
ncbi:MAG: FAD-binding oxidoreductase [Chloroflexota bacterium]